MLRYHIKIALKSLRRTPLLTVLLVAAIAVGICVSTTFVALRHLLGKDPFPGASATLYHVRIDSWGANSAWNPVDPKSIPTQLTYKDVQALMHSTIPSRQTPMYITSYFVFPDPKLGRPYSANARVVASDFFTMFRVPFRFGGPWSRAEESKGAHAVVIDDATNQRLFRGQNSVGRQIKMDQSVFRVAGVLAPWRPAIRAYDITGPLTQPPEPLYVPFNLTAPMHIGTTGDSDGWDPTPINTFDDFLRSEQVWVQLWVELPSAAKKAEYEQFIHNYIVDQKKLGRFHRPEAFKVTGMPDLLTEFKAVPQPVQSMTVVSLLFLIVCSMNLVGLLLGKFLARVPEVSVRRALGASRLQVFLQHVVECELIGVAGGAIGILLSALVLALIAKMIPNGEIVRMDLEVVGVALFSPSAPAFSPASIRRGASVRSRPAMQLKLQ